MKEHTVDLSPTNAASVNMPPPKHIILECTSRRTLEKGPTNAIGVNMPLMLKAIYVNTWTNAIQSAKNLSKFDLSMGCDDPPSWETLPTTPSILRLYSFFLDPIH